MTKIIRLKYILPVILFIIFRSASVAADYVLLSPDGSIRVTVTHANSDGALTYKVDKITGSSFFNIIATSRLGLTTNRGALTSDFIFLSQNTATVNETYPLPAGKRSLYHDHCNELTLNFSHSTMNMSMIFRAYNDGCAFRYYLPGHSQSATITAESTEFTYNGFDGSWGMKYSRDYSEYFESRTWNQVRNLNNRRVSPPFLTKHGTSDPVYCLLTEAANYGTSVAATLVAENTETTRFTLALGLNGSGNPSNITVAFPFYSPWRVLMIGSLPTIVESSMVEHLNPPSEFTDWSWIIPGRTAWDWGGEHTQNSDFNTNLSYIDLAGRMGWEYALMDAGWNDNQIPEIMNRANENGVKIWLWFYQNDSGFSSKANMNNTFRKYRNLGVVGAKIDFFENDNQAMMQKYDNLLTAAMEEGMMINFHGCTKPSGVNRRWPHLMTMEAVLGGEFYIQNSGMPTISTNINYALTRNVIGSMDYTPVEFATPARGEGGITRVNSSWTHQVAQSVVYESALQVFLDSPENYDNNISVEFLKRVPAAWDDIKCLEAMPDQYVTIARNKGDDWYLGALCQNARSVDVSLDFLGEGVYYAHIYKDGNCKTVIDFELRQVRKTDQLTIPMQKDGGLAVHFTKNPDAPVPQNIIVEAEAPENILRGTARAIADSYASGGYRVGNLGNGVANSLTINVNAPEEGTYAMSVFYCNPRGRRKVYLSVNEKKREGYFFTDKEAGSDCSRLNMRIIYIYLQAGKNTVRFFNEDDIIPDFDRFSFVKTGLATAVPQTQPDYVLAPYDLTDDGGTLSSEYANEALRYLTDNDPETKFTVAQPSGEFWIQYEAQTPVMLTGYALCSADDKPECDPWQWRLQGSMDGETWDLLHNGGQVFDRLETRVYTPAIASPYTFFRLIIRSVRGGWESGFQLADWQLYGYKTAMPEDNLLTNASRLSAQFTGSGLANLIDGANNSKYVADDNYSGWILYDLGQSRTILSYGIQNASNPARHNDPCSWQLFGSSNRVSWTPIDSRDNVFFMAPSHQLFLNPETQAPFRFIRLNIVDTNLGKPLELSGWQLYLTDEGVKEPTVEIPSGIKQSAGDMYNVRADRGNLQLQGAGQTAYAIYNTLGIPINTGVFDKTHTVNNLPQGMYVVRLGEGKNKVMKKVVIQ